ncbi:sodium/bile acid cotransporter 7-like [Cylas formicarius]|uniref:sodium/bile acid cotransporter 7-like n=1 Tax=Cylas formicarius TaxID=197179 RepID=UPI0029586B73|nr:sodium/bile acid cotransporter 7-like [Cylas formicarius]XP_060533439.1 sodium/bile acid cotransporter 7-like [Cylas formicarius]
MRHRITPADFLKKNWLLVGILCCIFLAGIYPKLGSKEGPLNTEYSVKYGAVFLMFLISGLSLKTENIFHTFQQHKLHLFIQCFTFVFIPIFTRCFTTFLSTFGINSWILKGLVTVACMPPPVSSAVILTRAAQGNETAAIFNSVVGSFLGIIITPISLLFNLGSTTIVPLLSTVVQLSTTVLLPLLIGQAIKISTNFRSHKLPLNSVSQCALLFVIYTTFCDTFLVPETGLSALDVIITIFSVLLLQIALIILSFKAAASSKFFSPSDIIAVVFCSTHKSLTLGIPILRIMFHGYSHLSQISLPLLVYHPTQIILGGLMVSQLKDWLHSQKNKKLPV